MNIYLIGFMGSGKTEVAKEAAYRLNKIYVEMDDIIEEIEGKSISRIFKEDGEARFREIEKEVVKELVKRDNQIVSTGGGVVLDIDNMNAFKETGVVICLKANPEVIYERTKEQEHRPLLKVDNPKEEIRELYNIREPFYRQAHFIIETSNLSIQEVAGKVIDLVKDKDDGIQ